MYKYSKLCELNMFVSPDISPTKLALDMHLTQLAIQYCTAIGLHYFSYK